LKLNSSDLFIDTLYTLAQQEQSETVVLQAKKCLLDYIGVTIAGSVMLNTQIEQYLENSNQDAGKVSVIGFKQKVSSYTAALINGMSAHVAELDDGHRFSAIHPGAPVISALLSVAEYEKITGKALLTGIIVGYEASIRLASAIQPSHKQKGYHVSGTCGTIGAALGIAAALGYSRKQMKGTLAAAATSASGLLVLNDDGSELKPYTIARATVDGVMAAYIGRVGFTGPDDVLGGKRGSFLTVMSDQADISYLSDKNSGMGIEGIYVKPYAACRHSHPAIEAALKIKRQHAIVAQEIIAIHITTYHAAVYGHDHKIIRGIGSAKMSIPYGVAAALVLDDVGINAFLPENIDNPKILSLIEKVYIKADDELSALTPEKRAAIVEIITNSDKYSERVNYPKGEPENPFSMEELEEKFYSLALFGHKTKPEAKKIVETILNIETKLETLFSLL
jgi:2-methylcitrate dehydratase PrpD